MRGGVHARHASRTRARHGAESFPEKLVDFLIRDPISAVPSRTERNERSSKYLEPRPDGIGAAIS